VIPGLTDSELEQILEAATEAGASWASYSLVRLSHELREIFASWLETELPTKAKRVLNRIRDVRGGRLNDAAFGVRHGGTGPLADLLAQRFEIARRRLGLTTGRPPLDTSLFHVPGSRTQGSLF
jgi:DNA repair photolyase